MHSNHLVFVQIAAQFALQFLLQSNTIELYKLKSKPIFMLQQI